MNDLIITRFVALLAKGDEFTADNVTDNGALTVDDEHTPNGAQSSIGSMFREHSAAGHIVSTGVVRSNAPYRKGGAIRVWMPTPAGQQWARVRKTKGEIA